MSKRRTGTLLVPKGVYGTGLTSMTMNDYDKVKGIESHADDPANFDELIEAAHWLLSIIELTDFKNGSGDRSLGENLAIDRLHDALKPRSKK